MGLFKTAAKVAVASSVHGRVQRRQRSRWAAQDEVVAPPAPAAPPAPHVAPAPPATAPSAPLDMAAKLDQLRQLGELRDAGVLTDAEFGAQKSAILSQ